MLFQLTNIFPAGGRNNYRIPSMITTKRGTTLAFCNNRLDTLQDFADTSELVLCRREKGGEWSAVQTVAAHPEWTCTIGSAWYDEETDTAMCMVIKAAISVNEYGNYTPEERAEFQRRADEKAERDGITPGWYILESTDDGKTWSQRHITIAPNDLGFSAFTHGSAAGIVLRHGAHKGRYLLAARYMTGHYTSAKQLKDFCFNATIYSDDKGQTWKTGRPVQIGTGEGSLIERGDGTILYNSRAYFNDNKRYMAISHDGGETFGEFYTDATLMEPTFGCNASFLRVEDVDGKNVTLFANPRHFSERRDMTVCLSYDDGATWPVRKIVHANMAAYSSLSYSAAEKRFFLLFEHGEGKNSYSKGLSVAAFDLEWLLSVE